MNGYLLIIPFVLIIIFMCPIFIQGKATLSLPHFDGVFSVFLFRKKLLHFFYQIKGQSIILKNNKTEIEQEFDFESDEIFLYEEILRQIKAKARLKEMYVFYNIGIGDAFTSAMLCGLINCGAITFFTSIKNKKPTASLGIYDTVSYNKEVFEISFNCKLSISLFDIVYSFINSVILSKKRRKNNI